MPTIMINCNNLTIDFAGRYLFKEVNLNLLPRNRYAIIGANGAGKSTFLKLLSQEEQASMGSVDIPKKAVLGMLKQDHFRYENERVIDVVLDGKPLLIQAFRAKEALLTKEEFGEAECVLLGELEEQITQLQGYSAESEAQTILQGLGIPIEAHTGPLSALSGGYKLRVLLAQALFKNPDILLLDEPTNHLDIISIVWLEKFLVEKYTGLLIFVSHDKQFINTTANVILDIDYETITPYPGNFDNFMNKKAEALLQLEQELANKQEKIAAMQSFVDRFGAKASKAKQAASRMKMIERIEITDIKNSSRVAPNFAFPSDKPTGKLVLEAKELSHAYGDRTLFMNLNFIIQRGTKLAVIGPNGVGKSTLLKILLDQVQAELGDYKWTETAKIGYFAQDFHHLLDPNQSLLQWLCDAVPGSSEMAARKALGQMLFSGADANKKIKVLSGGECARLIFAKLFLEKCNVLVLDEPTNHLDLEAIEGLADGLREFGGTVIFVSHNRFLISNVANHILAMDRESFEVYPGTYDEYNNRAAS
jgi:ATPase subunit of ABC transporter with duplicated ATPase domains